MICNFSDTLTLRPPTWVLSLTQTNNWPRKKLCGLQSKKSFARFSWHSTQFKKPASTSWACISLTYPAMNSLSRSSTSGLAFCCKATSPKRLLWSTWQTTWFKSASCSLGKLISIEPFSHLRFWHRPCPSSFVSWRGLQTLRKYKSLLCKWSQCGSLVQYTRKQSLRLWSLS